MVLNFNVMMFFMLYLVCMNVQLFIALAVKQKFCHKVNKMKVLNIIKIKSCEMEFKM